MPSASEAVRYPEPVTGTPPRVAFFPDAYEEVNGVAAIARQYTGWAAREGLPMLCVHAGGAHARLSGRGSVERLELPRGPLAFAIEQDLRYDPLFLRHFIAAERAVRRFRPDLVHITGPSDAGLLGALLARKLGVPMVASWHTNVHEYAVKRAYWLLRRLPDGPRRAAAARIEGTALAGSLRLYRAAALTLAPNEELCALLRARTGRPCRVTPAGVDTELFSPARRTAPRPEQSRWYTLGFVGRLSVEKNVAALPKIAETLRKRGFGNVRFLIVGHGSEEQALRLALPNGRFTGVLRGEALAEAFANMDLFVFPSHTDTFGMVVLEAMASGVPAVVTPDGGPAHIVRASNGGGVVARDEQFCEAIGELLADAAARRAMGDRGRAYALQAGWDAIFRATYAAYELVAQAKRPPEGGLF